MTRVVIRGRRFMGRECDSPCWWQRLAVADNVGKHVHVGTRRLQAHQSLDAGDQCVRIQLELIDRTGDQHQAESFTPRGGREPGGSNLEAPPGDEGLRG